MQREGGRDRGVDLAPLERLPPAPRFLWGSGRRSEPSVLLLRFHQRHPRWWTARCVEDRSLMAEGSDASVEDFRHLVGDDVETLNP